MNDRSCTDPMSKGYNDVRNIKYCFDHGLKLACISSTDAKSANLGWAYETSPHPPYPYAVYKDDTTHQIFREVVDHFKSIEPRLNISYFLNDLGDCMIGDIINGFFFGYCFVDIAEYVFIHNDEIIFDRIKKFVENDTKNNKNQNDPGSKADLIRTVTRCKKKMNSSFRTVFDKIHDVAEVILSKIQRHRYNFDMNSRVIHNIRIATMFHGDCSLNFPVQNYNMETETDTNNHPMEHKESDTDDEPGFGRLYYR